MSWKTLIHEALLMRQFVCNPIHCSNYCICYFIYYVLHYTVQCIVSFCNILLIHIKYFMLLSFHRLLRQAQALFTLQFVPSLMTKKRKKKQALKSYIICITGGVNYRQTDELICVYAFWAQPFFPQNAMWTDCQLLTELYVQLPKLWHKLEHPRACTYTAEALLCHC